MSPDDLFNYAERFARRSEAEGKGTQYPTFRQAAKRFKVSLSAVEDACNDWDGEGYMKPATVFRSGSGIGSFDNKGDWLVEAYR